MPNNKPKGKTPSLIGGTLGTPRECIVKKICSCNRCKDGIAKDTMCYEISQLGSSFTSYKRYCDDCFALILEQTKTDLDKLIANLQYK